MKNDTINIIGGNLKIYVHITACGSYLIYKEIDMYIYLKSYSFVFFWE